MGLYYRIILRHKIDLEITYHIVRGVDQLKSKLEYYNNSLTSYFDFITVESYITFLEVIRPCHEDYQ